MRRKLKIICILFFCIIFGYAAGCFTYLSRFPSEIRLTEFTTHRLKIGLPFSATLSETAAVSAVGSGRAFTIKTEGHGTAEMTIGAFGLPFRRITLDVVPEVEVVPLGLAIGVRINTDGVMILGVGSFLCSEGETVRPSQNLLQAGDLIIFADETEISNKEILSEFIAASRGDVVLTVNRGGNEIKITLRPEIAAKDDVRRIGVWVRDSTKGIGTMTFFNPATGEYGALGHGILDVDTKTLLSVKSGTIMPSTVISVNKGVRGVPGELEGQVDAQKLLGTIKTNCAHGIFGEISDDLREKYSEKTRYPIARRVQINEGAATILTNVNGTDVKEYEILIESVNLNAHDETKGIVIRITDPELLRLTGGIVQGMSGSPILQDGRIIGAITHVFVQDPTKGYAIFMESMIKFCPKAYSPVPVHIM
ncbi:MAG: SpoIVB peptidase [Defluviitaleaceae bacterium]|nr:SpoIVB peptidase [Defluviitaleaceae bacterium]